MKKIIMFLILISAINGLAQNFETDNIEQENIYPEENYEAEMFLQKQEDLTYPPTPNSEEFLAEEEVYDDEAEYGE